MLAGLLGVHEQAHAKQHKKFKLERTVNVGYPQDKLPFHFFPKGQPSSCYINNELIPGFETIIYNGSAVEPTIAVNPQNPKNIVAAWMQAIVEFEGALEVGIAYTSDGGKTWKRTEVPFQICEGGITQEVFDPWLSFSPSGELYLSCGNSGVHAPNLQNQWAIVVTISKDGGKTWSPPVAVSASNGAADNFSTGPDMDKPSITANPNHPELAYATWDTSIPNGNAFYAPTFFSRTTNGGKTWSNNTVSYGGEIWASMGVLLYDPFADLCAQGLSTCDRNFFTPNDGIPGDNATGTITNVIVVLPEADSNDKSRKKNTSKAKRFSGDVLNFMDRDLFPAADATPDEYASDFGQLTRFFTKSDIAVVRSQDLGANWNVTATVIVPNIDFEGNFDSVIGHNATYIRPRVFTGGYTYDADGNPLSGNGTRLRTGDGLTPAYAVNPKNGFLYTVYQTGQFRSDFLPQIGLTTSRDGGYTWSDRVRINQTPQNSPNPQAFTPFVAVTEDGYVGVLYSDFRNDPVAVPNNSPATLTDAWLDIYKEVDGPGSTGIGLDFVQEIRLSKRSYIAQNGPDSGSGVMTNGDYSFLVANKHNFYACFTQPHDGPFEEPIVYFNDPESGTIILLDDNYRQSPYVSVVKPVK
jgi:hypothetical protein